MLFLSPIPNYTIPHLNKAILSRQLPNPTPCKNFAVTLKGITEKVPHIIASTVFLGLFPFTWKILDGRDQFITLHLIKKEQLQSLFYHFTSLVLKVTTTSKNQNKKEY